MDTAVVFLGMKQPKLEADHLPPLVRCKISGAMSVRPPARLNGIDMAKYGLAFTQSDLLRTKLSTN
jgi:hypothetical protein